MNLRSMVFFFRSQRQINDMNKLQNSRHIEVKRCAVNECPYCLPHSSSPRINYCSAIDSVISTRVKYFPKCCPLDFKEN